MIISAKVGAGHMRAAEALFETFKKRFSDVEVECIEALEYTNAAFRNGFQRAYNKLASSLPSVWELIYETMEAKAVDSRVKRLANLFDRLNTRRLFKTVSEYEPDAVVCTHYLPAEILGHRKRRGRFDARIFVVLTDYDIHTMWIERGVDHYFVASEEMAHAMNVKGLSGAGVTVTGIPISGVFRNGATPRGKMREKLGLAPDRRTVLVSAGGFGLSNVKEAVSLLAETDGGAQFLAVAGKNEKLHKALLSVAEGHSGTVVPYGFVTNMHELMAASDFAVSKSGGLTSSECLAMGLPMVIWNPIPGQEERNADYLLENGAALRANSPAHLVFKVRRLIDEPDLLEKMRASAENIAKPSAAFDIAGRVLAAVRS
jgi:processive 1,2-diacylglycerol beta-glucosyltransferase